MNREQAVAIAGRIGSGKTTLASILADRLQCPVASFGIYVRFVALQRGLDPADRAVLQDLGEELIGEGWHSFCRSVLDHGGYVSGAVVVDGIRHVAAITTIRELVAPTPCRLVAVRAQDAVRTERLRLRGVTPGAAQAADAHVGESEVHQVIDDAEFVVDDEDPTEAADAVLRWLGVSGS